MTSETVSYWHKTLSSEARAAVSALPTQADAVVVGGGILGTCCAYWLARMGVQVLQLDQTSLAAGATGRNGGFVTIGAAMSYPEAINQFGHAAALEMWQLTYTSRQLLRDVLHDEQIDCDYREPGTLTLALSEAEFGQMQLSAQQMTADNMPAETIGRRQVQSLINTPVSDAVCGGKFSPNGGLLHSARFVHGLAKAAQRHGATTAIATLQGIQSSADGITLTTSAGPIHTRAVIVATNAWTRQLVPAMQSVITPVRGQILAYTPIDRVFTQGIGAGVTPTGEYWQQTLDGSIVLGGCRAAHPNKDVDSLSTQVSDDVMGALEQVMVRLFPKLGNLKVAQRWAGQMAFTPDYLPVLDTVPGIANAYFTGGFCGHGMPFGMIFGKLLAEAVSSEQPGQLPTSLGHFAASRPTLN